MMSVLGLHVDEKLRAQGLVLMGWELIPVPGCDWELF